MVQKAWFVFYFYNMSFFQLQWRQIWRKKKLNESHYFKPVIPVLSLFTSGPTELHRCLKKHNHRKTLPIFLIKAVKCTSYGFQTFTLEIRSQIEKRDRGKTQTRPRRVHQKKSGSEQRFTINVTKKKKNTQFLLTRKKCTSCIAEHTNVILVLDDALECIGAFLRSTVHDVGSRCLQPRPLEFHFRSPWNGLPRCSLCLRTETKFSLVAVVSDIEPAGARQRSGWRRKYCLI